jgi:hypothetical protein
MSGQYIDVNTGELRYEKKLLKTAAVAASGKLLIAATLFLLAQVLGLFVALIMLAGIDTATFRHMHRLGANHKQGLKIIIKSWSVVVLSIATIAFFVVLFGSLGQNTAMPGVGVFIAFATLVAILFVSAPSIIITLAVYAVAKPRSRTAL